MTKTGQLYTLGIWRVKQGNEADFVAAWQAFADWTTANQPGALEGILLQNEEFPQKFVSLGPWENAESVAEWRQQPQFLAFVSKARQLCEEMEPQNMTLVAHSSTRKLNT